MNLRYFLVAMVIGSVAYIIKSVVGLLLNRKNSLAESFKEIQENLTESVVTIAKDEDRSAQKRVKVSQRFMETLYPTCCTDHGPFVMPTADGVRVDAQQSIPEVVISVPIIPLDSIMPVYDGVKFTGETAKVVEKPEPVVESQLFLEERVFSIKELNEMPVGTVLEHRYNGRGVVENHLNPHICPKWMRWDAGYVTAFTLESGVWEKPIKLISKPEIKEEPVVEQKKEEPTAEVTKDDGYRVYTVEELREMPVGAVFEHSAIGTGIIEVSACETSGKIMRWSSKSLNSFDANASPWDKAMRLVSLPETKKKEVAPIAEVVEQPNPVKEIENRLYTVEELREMPVGAVFEHSAFGTGTVADQRVMKWADRPASSFQDSNFAPWNVPMKLVSLPEIKKEEIPLITDSFPVKEQESSEGRIYTIKELCEMPVYTVFEHPRRGRGRVVANADDIRFMTWNDGSANGFITNSPPWDEPMKLVSRPASSVGETTKEEVVVKEVPTETPKEAEEKKPLDHFRVYKVEELRQLPVGTILEHSRFGRGRVEFVGKTYHGIPVGLTWLDMDKEALWFRLSCVRDGFTTFTCDAEPWDKPMKLISIEDRRFSLEELSALPIGTKIECDKFGRGIVVDNAHGSKKGVEWDNKATSIFLYGDQPPWDKPIRILSQIKSIDEEGFRVYSQSELTALPQGTKLIHSSYGEAVIENRVAVWKNGGGTPTNCILSCCNKIWIQRIKIVEEKKEPVLDNEFRGYTAEEFQAMPVGTILDSPTGNRGVIAIDASGEKVFDWGDGFNVQLASLATNVLPLLFRKAVLPEGNYRLFSIEELKVLPIGTTFEHQLRGEGFIEGTVTGSQMRWAKCGANQFGNSSINPWDKPMALIKLGLSEKRIYKVEELLHMPDGAVFDHSVLGQGVIDSKFGKRMKFKSQVFGFRSNDYPPWNQPMRLVSVDGKIAEVLETEPDELAKRIKENRTELEDWHKLPSLAHVTRVFFVLSPNQHDLVAQRRQHHIDREKKPFQCGKKKDSEGKWSGACPICNYVGNVWEAIGKLEKDGNFKQAEDLKKNVRQIKAIERTYCNVMVQNEDKTWSGPKLMSIGKELTAKLNDFFKSIDEEDDDDTRFDHCLSDKETRHGYAVKIVNKPRYSSYGEVPFPDYEAMPCRLNDKDKEGLKYLLERHEQWDIEALTATWEVSANDLQEQALLLRAKHKCLGCDNFDKDLTQKFCPDCHSKRTSSELTVKDVEFLAELSRMTSDDE